MQLSSFKAESKSGTLEVDRNTAGGPLCIGGLAYKRGLGVEGPCEIAYAVPAGQKRFAAWVGVDDEDSNAEVVFKLYADGELAFDSGKLRGRRREGHMNLDRPVGVSVPLAGVKQIRLVVEGNGLADWADARFIPEEQSAWPWPAPVPAPKGALTPTPPMGLNTWNKFGVKINEKLIVEVADAMVSTGLRDAGYVYLNLDDGWQGDPERNDEGNPVWDKEKFPGGMKALADYIHSKGLKFGIYSRPAWVGGYEEKAARAFADWDVDYVKYDFSEQDAKRVNGALVEAVRAAGRPMVFNVCEWGLNRPWEWGAEIGAQCWRTTFDVLDRWYDEVDKSPGLGLLKAADQTEPLGRFAGSGRWNDPDMLMSGVRGEGHLRGGCNDTEYHTQMSLWCLLAAPLLIGCDVRHMDEATKGILLNREVIAIDQDPLGVQGWRARKLAEREVWMRPLADGGLAVGLLNRGETPTVVTARWSDLDITGRHRVRDLWAKRDLGVINDKIEREVSPHETVLVRLSPVSE